MKDRLTPAELRYLKAAWYLSSQGAPVAVGRIAERLGVSHPSASATVRRLMGHGLLHRVGSRDYRLTDDGEKHALRLVRRHRLLETFLAEILGFSWADVHDEAERLEWYVSDRLEERVAALLNDPVRDPHGDPIPPANGPHEEDADLPLADLECGVAASIVRVADTDPQLLRYLGDEGLGIGSVVSVQRQDPFGGSLWVSSALGEHALGPLAVQAIWVAPEPRDESGLG